MRRYALPLLFAALLALPVLAAPRWSGAQIAGLITNAQLDEISGLADSLQQPNRLWAINDGGNRPQLYLLDNAGRLNARVHVDGVENIDWEDLASFQWRGKSWLAIADTGDNGGLRQTMRIIIVEEPRSVRDGMRLQPAWVQEFRWPDGARDCEAMAVDAARGEILLVSKKRVPPELLSLPLQHEGRGVTTARLLGTLGGIRQPTPEDLALNPVYGRYRSQVTGADLSPNGRVLAVLNYRAVYLYTRGQEDDWRAALASPETLSFPWMPQAEAVAFADGGQHLFIASEQLPSALLRFQLQP